MKGDMMLDVMEYIDSELVEGADKPPAKKLFDPRFWRQAIAACIALMLLSTAIVWLLQPASQSAMQTPPEAIYMPYLELDDYGDYLQFLKLYKPSDELIRYRAFESLGEFNTFSVPLSLQLSFGYKYILTDPNGAQISVYIYKSTQATEEAGRTLTEVRWTEDGIGYSISVNKNAKENTLIRRLLSASDAVANEALAELKASIKASRETTKLELIWDAFLQCLGVFLTLLSTAMLILYDCAQNRLHFKQYGKKLPLSKKRYLLRFALVVIYVLILMSAVNAYIQPINHEWHEGLDSSYALHEDYVPHKLFLPGVFELMQLKEGMSSGEVVALLGKPQVYTDGDAPVWALYFGGTVTLDFNDNRLQSWEFGFSQIPNGWYLPGVLLTVCLLGLCLYRILFHAEKLSKKRCIIWMAIVLASVFICLLLINQYILPHYDDLRMGSGYRIFHPAVFNSGKVEMGMKLADVRELLGQPQKVRYPSGAIWAEWDLPLGAVFWIRSSKGVIEKGVKLFASTSGFIVPGVMLTVILIEVGIYRYLFHRKKTQALPPADSVEALSN